VYVVPTERFVVPVKSPPAPAPPAKSEPPPPPPATTKYVIETSGIRELEELNVWIVLPPLDVTVPPLYTCEPA
jgi:hypothetical protein